MVIHVQLAMLKDVLSSGFSVISSLFQAKVVSKCAQLKG